MSAPTDRLHDPRDLSIEAARWVRAAQLAQRSDPPPPTLVSESSYESEAPWSHLPPDQSLKGHAVFRRLRAALAGIGHVRTS
jgi:hypothetical protein